jgi:amino acid adenylation domain-containing protein/non-ribosomal peptide synthase protein (TIGR01720 family)
MNLDDDEPPVTEKLPAPSFLLPGDLLSIFAAQLRVMERQIEILAARGRAPSPPPRLPSPPPAFEEAGASGPRPLTEAQREIWALAQLGEGASVAYNLALSLRLHGPLRRDALARAVQGVVDRHEALRATIDPLGETQTFASHLPIALAWTDAGAGESPVEVNALLEAEARLPFDLSRGPLVRARLIRLGDELHTLALTVHHIVADARSLGVLLNEIARSYGAELSGEPVRLPEPASYGRWAAETVARQQGPEMERLEAFWLARLAPPLPSLELPADHPRPPVRSYAGDRHSRRLHPDLTADLKRLAGRSGATLFTLLLAGVEALLHRLAGQDDLIVGIPTVSPPAGGPLVGYCISFLPLRARLQEERAFAGLVQATRAEVLDAYEHQGYPFSRLVRKLGIAADPGRPPLLSTTFNLDRFSGLALPGLAVELAENPTRSAPFDIEWNAIEGPDGLTLDCIYSTDLFAPATIERWQEHLANLLAGAAADPALALGDLPLLGEAEHRQILRDWNATATPFPRETLIHELIAERAARAPAAAAAIFRDEVLTYGELDRRSNQLAHHLLALGLRPETLVGLCAERSLELAIALLGILKAGGAYLPLDPAYPRERLATLIEDAGLGMLVTQEPLLDRLPPHSVPVVLLDAEAAAIGQRPDGDPGRRTTATGLAYAIYTSGSTGRPKAVLVPHRPLVNYGLEMVRCFELAPEDRVLQFASISFDVMVEEIFPTWLAGAAVVLPEVDLLLSTADFQRALVRHGITLVELPTAFWREWATDLAATGSAAPETLRLLIVGGEKPSPDAVAAWARLGVPLLNIFGLTETTVTSSFHRLRLGSAAAADLEPPIGRPMANTSYYVLDRRGRPTPLGVPGELWIGGEGLARGYHRRPDLTAERFLPDPFGGEPGARLYRTGDLARHRPDGEVDHLGRIDHQVKVRGFRVELQEVESHLAALPEVRDAAVVARPGPGENRLIAYVVPRDGREIDAAGLRRALGDRLPAHMVPAVFVALDAMPWTASGKVDRRALPEPGVIPSAASDASRPFESPRTPAERTLADLWGQILRVRQVGLADRFFELGGDSILALQVLARARQAGLALSPRRVLEDPTLSELAGEAGALALEPSAAAPEPSGGVPLTPSQRWLLELAAVDPHHWNMSLLRRATPFVPAALARAAALCLERHDALWLRFERSGRTGDGDAWRQLQGTAGGPVPFTLVDLSGLPEAECREEIERAADRLQESLDLARGPLVRFAAFDPGPGEPGRLLAIAHQLVVDFVSWGILAEDLEAAYDALLQGREPRLPARSTAYAEWARRLDDYAQGDDLREELSYWREAARGRPLHLPIDHPQGINLESTVREVAVSLPPEETHRLLDGTPGPQVRELLLAAAALAVSGWTGEPRLRIDLEGHGREPLFDGVDLSRTVGWFASRYPLLLDLSGAEGSREALERVRRQIREVPRRGIGFGLLRHLSRQPGVAEAMAALPLAEVGFSYQGRLEGPPEDSARLTRAGDPRRASRSARALRHHVLEIECYVTGGRLEVIWQYSEALHRRSTIEAVVHSFQEALRRLF